MSLASRLPYDHPYAGGYPGIGSQPLPTDADALDYLARVKAADGAGVEVGVATAVDAFFRDTKAAGVFSALKACCILAGARTLAGALVPVVGDAPTNVADGFASGDYSRTSGLTGTGTSYIDSGRAQNADGSSNQHCSVFLTDTDSGQNGTYIGVRDAANVGTQIVRDTDLYFTSYGGLHNQGPSTPVAGFYGVSRSLTTSFQYRYDGTSAEKSANAQAGSTNNFYIFSRPYNPIVSSATCSFYSIGSAVDLEALDTAVTNLITAIGEAL